MSWLTFDVSSSIADVVREVEAQTQEAIRETGRQNKEALYSFAQSLEHMTKSQERIIELLTRIAKNTEPSK